MGSDTLLFISLELQSVEVVCEVRLRLSRLSDEDLLREDNRLRAGVMGLELLLEHSSVCV